MQSYFSPCQRKHSLSKYKLSNVIPGSLAAVVLVQAFVNDIGAGPSSGRRDAPHQRGNNHNDVDNNDVSSRKRKRQSKGSGSTARGKAKPQQQLLVLDDSDEEDEQAAPAVVEHGCPAGVYTCMCTRTHIRTY